MSRPVVVFSAAGYANLGDDAMYAAIVELIRRARPGAPIVHVVGPEQRWVDPEGVARLPYRSRGLGLLRTLPLLRRAEALVLVGGSVLHDYFPYAARRWLRMGWLGRCLGVRTIFIGCEVYEPLTAAFARSLRRYCQGAIRFLPRSERSADLLQRHGARHVAAVSDPVFTLAGAVHERLAVGRPRDVIGINLRPVTPLQRQTGLTTDDLCGRVASALAHWRREERRPRFRFYSFAATGEESDAICCELLQRRLPPDIPIERAPLHESVQAQLADLADVRLMIGMRFHSLVFGVLAGAACLALAYDPKIDALFRRLAPAQIVGCDFDPKALLQRLDAIDADADAIVRRQDERAREFARQTEAAFRQALEP